MKRKMGILCMVLAFCLSFFPVEVWGDTVSVDGMIETIAQQNQSSRDFWYAVGLAGCNHKEYIDLAGLQEEALALATSEQVSATDLEKAALGLCAVGIHPNTLSDENTLYPLLDQIMLHEDLDSLLNAKIYALLAWNAAGYEVAEDAPHTRESLLQDVLEQTCPGGGWAFAGTTADVDMTAIVLTALAPYQQDATIAEEVTRGLSVLQTFLQTDGSYGNAASTATVIVALRALGQDVSDQTVQSLLQCATEEGFGLTPGGETNVFATQQGFLALVSLDKDVSIYDFDEIPSQNTSPKTVEVRVEGPDHTILEPTTVTVDAFDLTSYGMVSTPEQATALHALVRALQTVQKDTTLVGTEGDYGYYLTEIDGVEGTGNLAWMYTVNHQTAAEGMSSYVLQENDRLVFYCADWSGSYSYFEQESYGVQAGNEVSLRLWSVMYGVSPVPCADAAVMINQQETRYRTDAQGCVTIPMYTEGEYLLSAIKPEGEVNQISRPFAKVTVTAAPSSEEDNTTPSTKTVTVSIVGDNSMGALLSNFSVTVPQGASVFTILRDVCEERNITLGYTGSGETAYISSVNGLAEFDYGASSGWMYQVNGKKPAIGIGQYIPVNGDRIALYYEVTYQDVEPSEEEFPSPDKTETTNQNYESALQTLLQFQNKQEDLSHWALLGLTLQGVPLQENVLDEERARIREKEGNLRLVTDYASLVILLHRMGISATDFEGYNLEEKIYSYSDMGKQGLNGYVFSLLALCQAEDIPADATWTLPKIVQEILSFQAADGGFPLAQGGASEVDMTAMAVSALVSFREQEEVEVALQKALTYLKNAQNEDGGYGYQGESSCESVAQVIVAFAGAGEDPKALLTVLLSYQTKEGGFSHTEGGKTDAFATEQALLALTAYQNFLEGKPGIYTAEISVPVFWDLYQASSWALPYLKEAHEVGILHGDGSGNCHPQQVLTRAEFVTLLMQVLEQPTTTNFQAIFDDVKEADWFWPYVHTGAEKGWIAGTGEGLFSPMEGLLRQDMAVLLMRSASLPMVEEMPSFADRAEIESYARSAVASVVEAGLMQGDGSCFSPHETVTREMAVVVMMKLRDWRNQR